MAGKAAQVVDFLVRVVPPLVKLGQDLYKVHNGDSAATRAEITDRREEIKRRRAESDAMLAAKQYDSDDVQGS